MLAKRKTTKQNTDKKEFAEQPLLTESEVKRVWDWAQFALSLNTGSGMYPGVLTPMLLNAREKDLNVNPLYATQDQLDNALKNPKDNEVALQSISEGFEILSQP